MVRAEENYNYIKRLGENKVDKVLDAGDPDANDDGYMLGTIWVNTTDEGVFICTDNTGAAAVWKEITFV